jgi:hypothetical protein
MVGKSRLHNHSIKPVIKSRSNGPSSPASQGFLLYSPCIVDQRQSLFSINSPPGLAERYAPRLKHDVYCCTPGMAFIGMDRDYISSWHNRETIPAW